MSLSTERGKKQSAQVEKTEEEKEKTMTPPNLFLIVQRKGKKKKRKKNDYERLHHSKEGKRGKEKPSNEL